MANKGVVLTTNQFLGNTDWLLSRDGRFAAVLQDDGNLVLCHASNGSPDLAHPYWSVFANGGQHGMVVPHGRYFAIMQGDGNLVLYNGASPAAQGAPYWATNTVRPGVQPYVLVLQDDGNLVVYTGTPTVHGPALWASNTLNPPAPAPTAATPVPPATTPVPSATTPVPPTQPETTATPPAGSTGYADETYAYTSSTPGPWTPGPITPPVSPTPPPPATPPTPPAAPAPPTPSAPPTPASPPAPSTQHLTAPVPPGQAARLACATA